MVELKVDVGMVDVALSGELSSELWLGPSTAPDAIRDQRHSTTEES